MLHFLIIIKKKKKECFTFSFGKEKKMNECSSCNNIVVVIRKGEYIYIGSMKISEETSFFIYLCWMIAEDMAESEPLSLMEKI